MENKSKERVDSTMKQCILSNDPYTESMNFVMTKLHYDVVLGEKWLHEYRAVIDFHTNIVEFRRRGKAYRMHAVQKGDNKQIYVNDVTKD